MQTRIWAIGGAAVLLAVFGAVVRLRSTSGDATVASVAPLTPDPAELGEPLRTRTASSNTASGSIAVSPALGAAPSEATTVRSPAVEARRATRQRADAIRKQIDERRKSAPTAPGAPALGPEAGKKEAAQRRREFIQKAVREQYFPVAKSCYEELLGRLPKAAGKIVLYFSIVGDKDTGGVVDHVETRDGTTFDDPEFLLCMRESMYSTLFDAPPNGGETTIEYPIELSP